MEYIHYGCATFEKEKFKSIKNLPECTKPFGGFWASRVNTKISWKNWCEDTQFETNLNDSFIFTLNSNAKVLTISNIEQLQSLPKIEWITSMVQTNLDFEKLAKEYDTIEVLISKDGNLYHELYGWDCDSILIMNPDIIEEGKEIEKEYYDIDLEIDV